MTRFGPAIAIIATATLSLSACGSSGGSPTSDPTTSAQSGPTVPHDGAPKVAKPLDTKKWEVDPCSLASRQEFDTYGFGKQDIAPDKGNGVCTWDFTQAGFSASFQSANGNGLSQIYQAHKVGSAKFFKPMTISGYPAATAEKSQDIVDNGQCEVYVGVRDDMALVVGVQADSGKPAKDPCKAASTVAEKLIGNMTKGS